MFKLLGVRCTGLKDKHIQYIYIYMLWRLRVSSSSEVRVKMPYITLGVLQCGYWARWKINAEMIYCVAETDRQTDGQVAMNVYSQ